MVFLFIYCYIRKVNFFFFKNTVSDECGYRYKDVNNVYREVLFKSVLVDIGRFKSFSEFLIRLLNLVLVIELVIF